MHVTDNPTKLDIFIAMNGTPREVSFEAMKTILDLNLADDYGDDFVVINGIRYEPLNIVAWTMYLEFNPDDTED